MFSRRHPFLFFVLISLSIIAASSIVISLIVLTAIKSSTRTEISDSGEKIGVIDIKGYIGDSREIIRDIRHYRENTSIKAIVLRIDSPGGAVGPSQEINREIQKTIPVKKVVASLGSVAASGGYYIAAAASDIMADPGTITGSIGVIMGFTDIHDLLQKIGVTPVVIKSGEYKDVGSPLRSMTTPEKALLQNFTDQVHRQFIDAVAKGRHLDYNKVAAIADGRILTGENAMQLGLVDRLGNLEDAIEWAGQLGGIHGKIKTVYARDKKFSFLKKLLESSLHDIAGQLSAHRLFAGYVLGGIPLGGN